MGTLKITQRNGSNYTTLYDFEAANRKLHIVKNAINFKSEYSEDKNVAIDTVKIIGAGADEELRNELIEIQGYLERAKRYHDPDQIVTEPVFWSWTTDNEAAKHALIYDYSLEFVANDPVFTPLMDNQRVYAVLAITHGPYESATLADFTWPLAEGAGDRIGLSVNLTLGTLGARITNVTISPLFLSEWDEGWLGIYPADSLGDMESIVSCYLTNTQLRTNADDTADANSNNGTVVEVDFDTSADLVHRFATWLKDANITTKDMAGTYILLLRCKLSDNTSKVRLRPTISIPDPFYTNSVVKQRARDITNDKYKWISLGTIVLPPGVNSKEMLDMIGSTHTAWIGLDAQRIEGSGSLLCDAWGFVPAQHYVYWNNPNQFPVNAGDTLHIVSNPRNEVTALKIDSTSAETLEFAEHNWFIPPQGGTLVVFAQSKTEHKYHSGGAQILGNFQIKSRARWKDVLT